VNEAVLDAIEMYKQYEDMVGEIADMDWKFRFMYLIGGISLSRWGGQIVGMCLRAARGVLWWCTSTQ